MVESPAEFKGLGAGETTRRDLSEDQIAEIVHAEFAERQSAADEYALTGYPDRAARLRAEVVALTTHLSGPSPPKA